MPINLRFSRPLNVSLPVRLRFGVPEIDSIVNSVEVATQLPAPIVDGNIFHVNEVAMAVTLPIFSAAASVSHAPQIEMAVCMPTFSLDAGMQYNNSVFRGVSRSCEDGWGIGRPKKIDVQELFHYSINLAIRGGDAIEIAFSLEGDVNISWLDSAAFPAVAKNSWEHAILVHQESSLPQHQLLPSKLAQYATWAVSAPIQAPISTSHQERVRIPRPVLATDWSITSQYKLTVDTQTAIAKTLNTWRLVRWQDAMQPKFGRTIAIPQVARCYPIPRGGNVTLRFVGAYAVSPNLRFTCCGSSVPPAAAVVVLPVRRAYFVMNDVRLFRVDGNLELAVTRFSMSIDRDSWTWTFSASLPLSSLVDLEPVKRGVPVILRAEINGVPYLLLAEDTQRERAFGKSGITVSGRGHSAVLDEPSSPKFVFNNASQDRTAQQLMNDALTINGVPIGWEVDWRIQDWHVPAGAWSHQGTYISAIKAIAKAAGAFVQADAARQRLIVLPRYASAPWLWGASTAPDIELPADVIVKEGVAWRGKANVNGIYVSGATQSGVLAFVKRAGTAGESLAEMIVDPLITHADAARQRAISVLADSAQSATYSLSLPVLPEVGIILPGKILRYIDGGNSALGVVTSVSVSATLPKLRQTIGVEVYDQ